MILPRLRYVEQSIPKYLPDPLPQIRVGELGVLVHNASAPCCDPPVDKLNDSGKLGRNLENGTGVMLM
jgi:hypothetical protein